MPKVSEPIPKKVRYDRKRSFSKMFRHCIVAYAACSLFALGLRNELGDLFLQSTAQKTLADKCCRSSDDQPVTRDNAFDL